MKPADEMALGIALMLLAGIASVLLGWWLLGAGLLALRIVMGAVTLASSRPPRRDRRRR